MKIYTTRVYAVELWKTNVTGAGDRLADIRGTVRQGPLCGQSDFGVLFLECQLSTFA